MRSSSNGPPLVLKELLCGILLPRTRWNRRGGNIQEKRKREKKNRSLFSAEKPIEWIELVNRIADLARRRTPGQNPRYMTPTDLWTLSHSTSVLSKAKFGHQNFFPGGIPGLVNIVSKKASPALHQPHSDPTRFLRSENFENGQKELKETCWLLLHKNKVFQFFFPKKAKISRALPLRRACPHTCPPSHTRPPVRH